MRECFLSGDCLNFYLLEPCDKLEAPLVIIKFTRERNVIIQKKAFYPVFAPSKITHEVETGSVKTTELFMVPPETHGCPAKNFFQAPVQAYGYRQDLAYVIYLSVSWGCQRR